MTVPCPQAYLDDLIKQRDRLLAIMTSGIQEIEQPQLGRTQYRSMADVQVALRAVNDQIAACMALDPSMRLKARRPIYPVVREV
jgi:hypothetical protein